MSTKPDAPSLPHSAQPEWTAVQRADDAPHPFRFGLQALMLLMAICGVQFALMSYLGILNGLLVGLATCFFVLSGLMAAAIIFWRGPGTPLMHRLDQLAIRLVVGIVLLALGSFFAGGGMAIYKEVAQWRKAARLQKELGFAADERYIVNRNDVQRGLVVKSVSLGGAFDVAGASPGDVVLCEKGSPRFYEMIEENRGREVSITVAAGADMQPVEKCVARRLDVIVPE